MPGRSLLEQIVEPANLWAAWSQVARKHSSPGVDGVCIEEFARHPGYHLKKLRREIIHGHYRPHPLRGAQIPKKRGGIRKVGVPSVCDRIAQRAWLNVVAPLVDARFADSSHAYRPARSIHTAIAQLERRRDAGCRFVLESDVENCFDSIDRTWMLQTLRLHIPEKPVLRLAKLWMETGIVWPGRTRELAATGIAQGDLISPLLCNLFLDRFDADLLRGGFIPVRYADDFVIPVKKEAAARCAFNNARHALARLGLEMNPDKTFITPFSHGFEFVGALFVNSLVLPVHRREHPNGNKPKHVTYSYGYEADTAFLPHQRPAPPCPPIGADAVATAHRNASPRLRQSPIGIALTQATTRKRRRQRQKLMQAAEREAGFLI